MRWATITETSKHTSWSEYSIRRAVKTGRWPHIFIAGRYLIDLDSLDIVLADEARTNQQKARAACKTID